MIELNILSTGDGTSQPVLFHKANSDNRPLLVGFHTWSHDRFNQVDNMLPYAVKYDWNLLLPEFRGPNLKKNTCCKDSCGSDIAIRDVFDAIEYVAEKYSVDEKNVFLLGASGGGQMTLLTLAQRPEKFKAAAAFVPLCDLEKWYYSWSEKEDIRGYKQDIEACLGGAPSKDNIAEYKKRSPICYIKELSRANLKIFHGKYDDTISVTQSIDLFGKIFDCNREAHVFLDIFDGGHEMDMESAFYWFMSQSHNKKSKKEVTG